MYLQGWFSEEEWAQLEGAASCAKVLKVEVDVDYSARGARSALVAGLVKNEVLREVKLFSVPVEEHESLRETLCSNRELTVFISETRPQ